MRKSRNNLNRICPYHSGQTAIYGSYHNHTLICYIITDNLSCFNTNRYGYFLKTHQYHLVYGSYDGHTNCITVGIVSDSLVRNNCQMQGVITDN